MPDGTAFGSNLGFNSLPRATLTCGLEELGIEPLGNLLYLLSHSRHCHHPKYLLGRMVPFIFIFSYSIYYIIGILLLIL